MRNFAEVVGQIAVDNLVLSLVEEPMHTSYRVVGASFRSVGVLLRLQVGFEDRLKHEHGRCLRHPVPYAGNAQRPEFAGLFLRYQNL